jgi:hypothetical protein
VSVIDLQRPRVYVGFDANELMAVNSAIASMRSFQGASAFDIRFLALSYLCAQGLYTRPTERRDNHLWDVRSEAPMTTEHAIARFFVPLLCEYRGWALFMDGDVLVRRSLADLFALADPTKAVQVVQHPPMTAAAPKKEGQPQTLYTRKNWSSVMLFNCAHPSNHALTIDLLNTLPGRDLHRFCWLDDREIGALPPEWNYLVGVNAPQADPAIVHYTLGCPKPPSSSLPFADEWFAAARAAKYDFAVGGIDVLP